MHKMRVGVLRGGPSNEYDVSLNTGATVLAHLPQEKYIVRDILIDKNGQWHMHGIPHTPHEVLTHIDVAFNALHGNFGEDGKIQHLFESHNIPFTGSGSFASALGMNKKLTKEVYTKEKIKTPQSRLIESLQKVSEEAHKLFKSFPLPIVVKPVASGSSIGVSIAQDFAAYEKAIAEAFEHGDAVMIEEFINGREASCGVIDDFRDQEFYALPVAEIVPHKGRFFDYAAKYKSEAEEIIPGNFSPEEKKEMETLAIQAHKILGLRHYSRSDFIIHPRRGIFILETNTLPGLTEESLFPKMLNSVGSSLSQFFDHIVQLALHKK